MACWKNTRDCPGPPAFPVRVRRWSHAIVLLSCSLTALSCVPAAAVTRDHGQTRPQRPEVSAASLEKKIHVLINQDRKKHGLAPLVRDDVLSRIARSHSCDMARRRYFSHESPEGGDFSDRYRQARYACSVQVGPTLYLGAENIALNNLYASVRRVNGTVYYEWSTVEEIARTTVQGWMDSTGHRKNILTPYWGKEGIGVCIAPDDRIYITQNFC